MGADEHREANEATLDALMARLADGDRAAFDPLFDALYPRALRLARLKLGGDGAADVAQNTMLRVFDRAAEFIPGRPVLPWFYAIAANEVRALQRAARAQAARTSMETTEPVADDDPERALLDHELHAVLDRAIASLDSTSAEAIGALLGRRDRPPLDDAAWRKRVSRAYARLRVLLGGSYGK